MVTENVALTWRTPVAPLDTVNESPRDVWSSLVVLDAILVPPADAEALVTVGQLVLAVEQVPALVELSVSAIRMLE